LKEPSIVLTFTFVIVPFASSNQINAFTEAKVFAEISVTMAIAARIKRVFLKCSHDILRIKLIKMVTSIRRTAQPPGL